jgi:hypothetical protein
VKQFCIHGHDRTVVGVSKAGACMECRRVFDRIRDKTERRVAQGRVARRRYYQRSKEKYKIWREAWLKNNIAKQREYEKRSRAKYKGVNFWVEMAKESL